LGFGEARRDAGPGDKGAALATPFAQQLASVVPSVVGWDGSVYDVDATLFAASFYRALAGRSSIAQAAAVGRLELLQQRLHQDGELIACCDRRNHVQHRFVHAELTRR
jgi:hypothetical protein